MTRESSSEKSLRTQLYEVIGRDDLSLTEKRERALAIGVERLGANNSDIRVRSDDGPADTVVASVSGGRTRSTASTTSRSVPT